MQTAGDVGVELGAYALVLAAPIVVTIVGILGAVLALKSLAERARPEVGFVLSMIWLPICGACTQVRDSPEPLYPGLVAFYAGVAWFILALLAKVAGQKQSPQ